MFLLAYLSLCIRNSKEMGEQALDKQIDKKAAIQLLKEMLLISSVNGIDDERNIAQFIYQYLLIMILANFLPLFSDFLMRIKAIQRKG